MRTARRSSISKLAYLSALLFTLRPAAAHAQGTAFTYQGRLRECGAAFIIGIGGDLGDGTIHDGRAPDYDDWSTPTGGGRKGLNGDIFVWNPMLRMAFELSSMGIRVDKQALLRQLKIRGCMERKNLLWHQKLLNDEMPLSIGGGIGPSRLCMYFLRKAHVGAHRDGEQTGSRQVPGTGSAPRTSGHGKIISPLIEGQRVQSLQIEDDRALPAQMTI